MNKTKNLIKFISGGLCSFVFMGAVAYASIQPRAHAQYFSTTVGRFNGSGYSPYQTKTISGANGSWLTPRVGGGYKVDARMQDSGVDVGPWTRWIVDSPAGGVEIGGHANIKAGESTRLQISNDITTPVNVQCSGYFASK